MLLPTGVGNQEKFVKNEVDLFRFVLHAAGSKGLKVIMAKLLVDLCNTAGAVIKTDHQQGISWNFGVKLGHFILFQSLLCLGKSQFTCVADPQDHISLPGLFLTGEQFVAVSFRDLCLKKYLLLGEMIGFQTFF